MIDWIEIKGSKPKSGEEVLVYVKDCPSYVVMATRRSNKKIRSCRDMYGKMIWFTSSSGQSCSGVTHWARINIPQER